eukprot:scaffold463_cov242-Pinguiococcus_pyrenoidosus.AAC.2
MSSTKFTVLGLGDTNYNKFCAMGIGVDKRMKELGGERFYPLGCADEGTGLEDVVEPWLEGFWPALEALRFVSLTTNGRRQRKKTSTTTTITTTTTTTTTSLGPMER